MLKPTTSHDHTLTAVDLAERFGPISLARIRHEPLPGHATEDDLFELSSHDDRLYELIDGTLVEKTMGNFETLLAVWLCGILDAFVLQHDLGLVTAPDGRFRLAPEQIRVPDLAFISWQRLPDRKIPYGSCFDCGFDLAVEIISPSNTRREMESKLEEYFAEGTRAVWYVYPLTREIHVFSSPTTCQVLHENDTLTGGEVLPGFELPLKNLFARLGKPDEGDE